MDNFTWTVEQIRAAEAPLVAKERYPDELMQSAAQSVAEAAHMMLARLPRPAGGTIGGAAAPAPGHVLVLAGPGGNGGDGLYAGAELARDGHRVDAYLTAGTAHRPALKAFTAAGGRVVDEPEAAWSYQLATDAITGIGGRAGLDEDLRELVEDLAFPTLQVLSVDVPSGIDADTGAGGDLHVTADVTVTFGGWRRAHALSPACGEQLLADASAAGLSLTEQFRSMSDNGELGGTLMVFAHRASGVDRAALPWPAGFTTLGPARVGSVEPSPQQDKYTGGVVGICAGSEDYPGAAILCAAAAVDATPGMVRYAGPQALEVVRAHPEVVATHKLEDAGRVQAWVFGPGAGEDTAAELRWVLEQDVPLLIDATGLTLLTQHEELRRLAAARRAPTVLTPHDGEFERLRTAVGLGQRSRLEETTALAAELNCIVVRKGRSTIVAPPSARAAEYAYAVDAGNSWAATPGSGDVLAGLIGARVARAAANEDQRDLPDLYQAAVVEAIVEAVNIHAAAAKLAARTEYGEATAPAGRIAGCIREATALLTRRGR